MRSRHFFSHVLPQLSICLSFKFCCVIRTTYFVSSSAREGKKRHRRKGASSVSPPLPRRGRGNQTDKGLTWKEWGFRGSPPLSNSEEEIEALRVSPPHVTPSPPAPLLSSPLSEMSSENPSFCAQGKEGGRRGAAAHTERITELCAAQWEMT